MRREIRYKLDGQNCITDKLYALKTVALSDISQMIFRSGCNCRYLSQRRNKEGRLFTAEIIVVDDGSKDATARSDAETPIAMKQLYIPLGCQI